MTSRHARLLRRDVIVIRRHHRGPVTAFLAMCWLILLLGWLMLKWSAMATYWTCRWTYSTLQKLWTSLSASSTERKRQRTVQELVTSLQQEQEQAASEMAWRGGSTEAPEEVAESSAAASG